MDNWDVLPVHIRFFENALKAHRKIKEYNKEDSSYYKIYKDDDTELNVLLVNRYLIGIADIHQAISEFVELGLELNCVVATGEWDGYTPEAKEFCIDNKIGLFIPSEFSGALWQKNYWLYAKKDEKGKPTYSYKNP